IRECCQEWRHGRPKAHSTVQARKLSGIGQGLPAPRSDNMTTVVKPIATYMEERGVDLEQLVSTSRLEAKMVKAIVSGNYTPSPSQRQRLAAALGVSVEDISWGHAVSVEHLRGNGPQCGRST